MTTTYTLEGFEAEARIKLDAFDKAVDWSPSKIALMMVWKSQFVNALTKERIEAIGCALCSFESWDATDILRTAVRMKLLRSYRKQGRYLYEIAY